MDELHDLNAEQTALGSVLIDTSALVDVSTVLRPADFYDDRHRWIYEAMLSLQTEQTSLDPMTIAHRLDTEGHLVEVGGSAYLSELIGSTPTAMHAMDHARIVNRLGTLRKLMAFSANVATLAYNAKSEHLDGVFSQVRQMLDAATPIASDAVLLTWANSLDAFFSGQFERVEELEQIEKGTAPARVTFPWVAVQRFVKWLRAGMLAVIAAESSVGKTTAMECCAEYWARQGLHVVFFHLELSHRFMLDRRMVRQSGVPLEVVETGEVTGKMRDADVRMRAWPGAIHYVHCPGWSAYQIVQKARQLRARGMCDVLVVDYLQKLRLGYRNGQNKADAVGNAVEGIKNGLEQMGIPGVIGSQFNRQAKHQQRKTAALIRSSGEVEEKANVVITLDREILDADLFNSAGMPIAAGGDRSPVTKVRIDKNTAGPTGDCELVMNGARFMMLDKED
jgi:replicative DNA helicase